MSGNVTEVLTLTLKPDIVTETYVKQLFEVLHKQKGYHGGWWGCWLEAPEKVQMLHQWDAISSNYAFAESADFQAILAIFDPVMAAPPSTHHVFFDAKFPEVVKAPINEVTTFYGPDENFEAFDFENLAVIFRNGVGFGDFTKGAAVEELTLGEDKVKAYNVLAGWESAEAHGEIFKTSEVQEGMAKYGSAFQGLKGREVHHVKFVSG